MGGAAMVFVCPVVGQPALQFVGEQQVGQLGLPVGGDPVVAVFPLQIVEVDRGPDSVARAADGHHPRAPHRQQVVQQQPGQREVAQMVSAELHLEPVGGELLGRPHHPGVVDQQVDPRVGLAQRAGGGAHRGQRAEVEFLQRDVGVRVGGDDAGQRELPFSRLRTASTTWAPASASAAAVW